MQKPEFQLNEKTKLGLMPNNGINKLFSKEILHPDKGDGILRCELYLTVNDVAFLYKKALPIRC